MILDVCASVAANPLATMNCAAKPRFVGEQGFDDMAEELMGTFEVAFMDVSLENAPDFGDRKTVSDRLNRVAKPGVKLVADPAVGVIR